MVFHFNHQSHDARRSQFFSGIEYGDMQLIAEAYDILKRGLGLNVDEIADIFQTWNKGVLDSFLIEITADILKYKDDDGEPVLDKILDKAGQKGTGKWTAIAALDAGVPGISSFIFSSEN
jgi:6-phosphogluconate dehydrogenase